jgi:hypothetical protein
MKWELIRAAAIAMAAACVTTACSDSGTLAQPSSLPSAARPGGNTTSGSNGSPTSSNDSSLCTSTEPCPGGVDAGPPPESSCSMMTNGIEVVVNGSSQSNGTVLAKEVGQVPPGTQPAPDDDVVARPGTGDGSYSVAKGDALGPVANLQGQCPSLTFTVGGRPVVTNGSTRYHGLPSPPPSRP